MDNHVETRGRPRKNPIESEAAPPGESASARGRGRPRMDETPENTMTVGAGLQPGLPPGAEMRTREQLRNQTDADIFALDIGTRTVVGVVGRVEAGVFRVVSCVTVPHKQRAMTDGQIEDIREVARVVNIVKSNLEQKCGIRLERAAIAAAGRALKTRRVKKEFPLDEKSAISEEQVEAFEIETVLEAQNEPEGEPSAGAEGHHVVFYCVGHTVINYAVDGYKMRNLVGHRGKKASVEVIAAFLPGAVVESLYSVLEMCSLEVGSLTLEPIAAMNVIIPPEVRLINIALVDIGAGTSDIAISQNGSIVAYAMSTLAGDEVTEEIIKTCLVDFQTAEEMKQCGRTEYLKYTDILGHTHRLRTADFFRNLSPVLTGLADNIAENIVKANGGAPPAAVFLVGGGSLVPNLSKALADKLGLPENRVAVGGKTVVKHIDFGKTRTDGPEYVTPVGIGLTATMNKGYDFSVVTLNGKKMRIFNTKTVTLTDLLTSAGYDSSQIIGRSGRNLTYTLDGENRVVRGELSTPAEIALNGRPVPISTAVRQGDKVSFTPAVSGKDAALKISDLPEFAGGKTFLKDGVPLEGGYMLKAGDVIVTSAPPGESPSVLREIPAPASVAPNEKTGGLNEPAARFDVTLNGKAVSLEHKPGSDTREFIELLPLADVDLDNPPPSGVLTMLLNGEDAGFMSPVKPGDDAVIKWADK